MNAIQNTGIPDIDNDITFFAKHSGSISRMTCHSKNGHGNSSFDIFQRNIFHET